MTRKGWQVKGGPEWVAWAFIACAAIAFVVVMLGGQR